MNFGAILRAHLTPLAMKLQGNLLQEFEEGFAEWQERLEAKEKDTPLILINDYFGFLIRRELQALDGLLADFTAFEANYSRTLTWTEKTQHLMNYARQLGSGRRDLRRDRSALKRWFGFDTLRERFANRRSEREARVIFCLDRLAAAMRVLPKDYDETLFASPFAYWQRLQVEDLVRQVLDRKGDTHLHGPALRFLASAVGRLGEDERPSALSQELIQWISRGAVDPDQPIWGQAEALALLRSVDPASFFQAAGTRLARHSLDQDVFVRKKCLMAIRSSRNPGSESSRLIRQALGDPSPFVRLEAGRSLAILPDAERWQLAEPLARQDPSVQVRGGMVHECLTWLSESPPTFLEGVTRLVALVLEKEEHPFVLRVGLKVVEEGITVLSDRCPEAIPAWIDAFRRPLTEMQTRSPLLVVRRQAASARLVLWCHGDRAAASLLDKLGQRVAALKPGETATWEVAAESGGFDDTLGRVMALLAQADYGLQWRRVGNRVECVRGEAFRFKWWRWLHEIRHPSPDKRQAFSHTRGRHFTLPLRAPSRILTELTPTKVPGEPLVIADEGGGRPFLPLVDDFLASLRQPGRIGVSLFTAEGRTQILPPRGWHRVRAWLALTWTYSRHAERRNWTGQETSSSQSYLEAMTRLGFQVNFAPHDLEPAGGVVRDPSVVRFFPSLAFYPLLPDLLQRMKEYFLSIYENSLFELVVFTTVVCLFFFGRHIYLNSRQKRRRQQIPLVIGGWGTRGKSGTERLKAALLNAAGFSVVCKTTGSDATFLFSRAHGRLEEIPVFRPYDKATIWEQHDLTELTQKLGADAFLWECMALQPSYVHILQQCWMRDDLSTITNAYPDHEDVMGPAGIDVPEVMTRFIPPKATLLTAEEQMAPILAHGARLAGSRFLAVGWLEAGLLTSDVMNLFPYQEHPSNVALVVALARELGLDDDFALQAMAERVVPEIGNLKVFPDAPLRGRRLQFINGMAANERVGCLSNWERVGLASQDYREEPGVYVSTVVNNRADRIARSRVFADILVRDLDADCHFLIGTNLTGLLGYIRESWDEHMGTLKLWPSPQTTNDSARNLLERMMKRFRLPTDENHVRGRGKAMLAGYRSGIPQTVYENLLACQGDPDALLAALKQAGVEPGDSEAMASHLGDQWQVCQKYGELTREIETAGSGQRNSIQERFQHFLWQRFEKKLVVVWDPHATGTAIVNAICDQTPPGLLNRVMGIQNIKQTGMDFVTSWQNWDLVYRASQMLTSSSAGVFEEGLASLETLWNYPLQSREFFAEALNRARSSPLAQNERVQAKLFIIAGQAEAAFARLTEQLGRKGEPAQPGWIRRALQVLEQFMDIGDAVRRKKKAKQIYRDLVSERISVSRAAQELHRLGKRQKGGWLSAKSVP